MGLFRNQTHILTYVFILLESLLCCYPFIRFFHKPVKNKWWLPLPPVLLLIYNLNGGFSMTDDVQLLVNTVFILLTAILIVSYNIILAPKRMDDPKSKAERKARFLENCRKFGLSGRETEVAWLLREGHKYREIAEILFISDSTVDTHVQNIYAKVGVRSKVALFNQLDH